MNQIGKHVCVSYPSMLFGDWLRLFISYHEGFKRFDNVLPYKEGTPFRVYDLRPYQKIYSKNIWSIDCFKEEFEKISSKDQRIVYKIKDDKNFKSHTLFGTTWQDDKTDTSLDYDIIRQSDHQIIFVKVHPNSEAAEIYFDRIKKDISAAVTAPDVEGQRKTFETYFNLDFPKHKLNYEIELNKLFEYNENAYNELCNFLKVKPLPEWRDYIDEFNENIHIEQLL